LHKSRFPDDLAEIPEGKTLLARYRSAQPIITACLYDAAKAYFQ
jgi:hypothetical protein